MTLKYVIITSIKDVAGRNIKSTLERMGVEVHEFDEDIVHLENIDKNEKIKDYDFIIFASRHYSKEGRKNFCVHAIGNWKGADYGGKNETIVKTSAIAMKEFSIILDKNIKKDGMIEKGYDFSMESTHHGPFIEKPCMFVEVGGTEKEWKDLEAVEVLAKSIKEFINLKKHGKFIPALAVGGPHYCSSFNSIQLNSDYAMGHVAPKHALPIGREIIEKAIRGFSEKVETAIVDYKGLGNAAQRDETISLLKESGLRVVKSGDV